MNKLDLEETTRRFHNVYEQVAKEYGYKTREDTKELDFNSPNGMTMLKTVETITTPYLEEIERLNNIIKLQDTRNSRQRIANRKLLERNQDLVIENLKLNNIINKGIEAINVYQNEKTLSLGYQDLKRIRGILQGNEFDLQMFEKYLQELKGENSEFR